MRPIKLTIQGFLSYRDLETIDFTSFDVACITGENGAGKSSILDAMTFALFGKARVSSGDALINIASEQGEVNFEFSLNGTHYRVIRKIYKNYKSTESFLHYLDPATDQFVAISGATKTLMDEEIKRRLNMDYETFTTASFFLQGKADSFATAKPSKRKEILSKILRLEHWEVYHQRAKDRLKEQNMEKSVVSKSITELKTSIAEEPGIKAKVVEIKREIEDLESQFQEQRSALGNVDQLLRNHESAKAEIEAKESALAKKLESAATKLKFVNEKDAALKDLDALIARADEIQVEVDALERSRNIKQEQEKLAIQVSAWEKEIVGLQDQIEIKENQLRKSIHDLTKKEGEIRDQVLGLPDLKAQLAALNATKANADEHIDKQKSLTNRSIELESIRHDHAQLQIIGGKYDQIVQKRENSAETLRKEQTTASDAATRLHKYKTDLDTYQHKLNDFQEKAASCADLREKIREQDGIIKQAEQELAKVSQRAEHLRAEHSPNCPTCERPLSVTEGLELQKKLIVESSACKGVIDSTVDKQKELNASLEQLIGGRKSSDPFKSEIDEVTAAITSIKTKIEIDNKIVSEWNPIKQAELESYSTPTTEMRDLQAEVTRLMEGLRDRFIKLFPNATWTSPSAASAQIDQEREILTKEIETLNNKIEKLKDLPVEIQKAITEISRIEQEAAAWESKGKLELQNYSEQLASRTLVKSEIEKIEQTKMSISSSGYDPDSADAAEEYIKTNADRVEKDAFALKSAPTRVSDLNKDIETARKELDELNADVTKLRSELELKKASLGNETELIDQQQRLQLKNIELEKAKNDRNIKLGSQNQLLADIDTKKGKLTEAEQSLGKIQNELINLEILEQAFGKGGLPALLIEQAKPELEVEANRILSKLTDGFTVHFQTQRSYKDQKREDMQETLEIEISDGSGTREYDTFSGGETFRVNFAVRLALSKMLAKRADAKLETLVIDEGFGSQDEDGKQKLVEAIKAIQSEFKMILVVTHLEDLKEKFDRRIEVNKSGHTSRIKVS